MLKTTEVVKTPSVESLIQFWAQRYQIDLSSLSLWEEPSPNSLVEAASSDGRALTCAKLNDNSLNINSQMGWIQTKNLHNYIPNILDFNEARKITESAFLIYKILLKIYQQKTIAISSLTASKSNELGNYAVNSFALWEVPPIAELATTLKPILMLFQEQHLASKDWHALGFMTTQLKFTNKLILNKLTPVEKILLRPYLKFVEEQVAIPWERICAASAKHESNSPILALVEQMLPACEEITQIVYRQMVELFPNHRSRSGDLTNPSVAHSCIRDLNMFQAYLWLSVLEQSLAPVEQELVNLCLMVMEKVEVKWEYTQKWTQLLVNEIISRLKPEQKAILFPYTQGMRLAFFSRSP